MNFFRFLFGLLRFDRANWKAVSLCVLTAVVFWIFTALNKNYSTNVRFPIVFEFDGEKYATAQPLPKTVNMNVSGNGWNLFRKRVGLKVPHVVIPLERPSEVKKIVGSTLAPIMATQIGNVKINFVVTDTLYLHVDKRIRQRYKLVADISAITFRKGYGRISPVVVLPDSVELDGPESRLKALADSILLPLDTNNVNENFRDEVEIGFLGNEFINRNPPVAQVIFEVGPVQEVSKRVKLIAHKKPYALQADSASVWFQVPVSKLEDFNLAARELSLEATATQLNVMNLPSYALPLRMDSVRVK